MVVFYCKLKENYPEMVEFGKQLSPPDDISPDFGYTLELCAGLVDKDKPLAQVAAEEVHEECGYKVKPEDLKLLACGRQNVGLLGGRMSVFFCEVTDDMLDNQAGGGLQHEGEFIEVVYLPVSQVDDHLRINQTGSGIDTSFSLLYSLMWAKNSKII
ncbi:Nudix hydrolase 14, chloroplastic [Cichlidogyrus casuarinus]|uniref:Nudix hydrolase 14, chloroplastic n=1 Tax=Cichlidogyrus casuarinus TaxID=1844966 RepID=A0ABD2QNT1_9PLAT